MMMDIAFGSHRTVYAAADATYDTKYQQGGTLLTLNGSYVGRHVKSGVDKWGRYCWMKLQCGRDEGMLVINAYRVCQERTHNPGAFTVYTQQHTDMRVAGVEDLNPRKQILKDIAALINKNRKEGWRPIVMMDANGDTHHDKDLDQDLVDFLEEANLKDPYYDKFPGQIRTYLYGNKRLDYIWMDEAYVPAIKAIGYLETHQGALTNHPAAYVDFYEDRLFKGITNRPIPMHSRE
ncbi:hypothetical protein ACHAWF_000300, partial [Thalassiosira exigua]